MIVIADEKLVDMTFGTGAVKITPAHDNNDFNCGKRHGLPMINILNENGKIHLPGSKYHGMPRYECREAIEKDLIDLGLFKDKNPNPMVLGICSKTGDIIEPFLKP